MLGWTFNGIGREENTRPFKIDMATFIGPSLPKGGVDLSSIEDDSVMEVMKCAQYCEGCGKFIGRWVTNGSYKVWCKECAKKLEDNK